jgi:hypothetical protein
MENILIDALSVEEKICQWKKRREMRAARFFFAPRARCDR